MKKLLYKIGLFFYDPILVASYRNRILTLIHKSNKVEKYHGSCTCWSTYPDMYEVGVMDEGRLYRYWKLCNIRKNRRFITR